MTGERSKKTKSRRRVVGGVTHRLLCSEPSWTTPRLRLGPCARARFRLCSYRLSCRSGGASVTKGKAHGKAVRDCG